MTTQHIPDAREAVLDRLEAAYEAWAEKEQLLTGAGEYVQAQGAHEYALIVLRAMDAEATNPPPKGLATRGETPPWSVGS